MNIDDPEAVLYRAERRVLEIQTKLHHWAGVLLRQGKARLHQARALREQPDRRVLTQDRQGR